MLYLSAKIEYALNLLVFLAKAKSRVSLEQAAQATRMPHRFLNKISRDLVKAKLIKAKEGKGGGYLLVFPPAAIKLKYVLEALGEPISLAQCFTHKNCPLGSQKHCKIKLVWRRIKKIIDRELNQITLKDLI